jgi:hypothetical protein
VDHFLAARRFSEGMGLESFSYAGVPAFPPPGDATLVAPVASLQSEGILDEVADWMNKGGNLIAYLEPPNDKSTPTKVSKSWQPFLDYFAFKATPVGELDDLERAQITMEKSPLEKGADEELAIENLTVEDRYETAFTVRFLLQDAEASEETAWSSPCLSYDYGAGTLTVLTTAEPFANKAIERGEHATLLWDLLAMGQGG